MFHSSISGGRVGSAGTNPGRGYGSQHQEDLKSMALKQASRAWQKKRAATTPPGLRLAPHHRGPGPGVWWGFPIPPSSRHAGDTETMKWLLKITRERNGAAVMRASKYRNRKRTIRTESQKKVMGAIILNAGKKNVPPPHYFPFYLNDEIMSTSRRTSVWVRQGRDWKRMNSSRTRAGDRVCPRATSTVANLTRVWAYTGNGTLW